MLRQPLRRDDGCDQLAMALHPDRPKGRTGQDLTEILLDVGSRNRIHEADFRQYIKIGQYRLSVPRGAPCADEAYMRRPIPRAGTAGKINHRAQASCGPVCVSASRRNAGSTVQALTCSTTAFWSLVMEIFDYDKVLLLPRKCRVESRSECDAGVELGGRTFRIPVVPANMKTVVDEKICLWLAQQRLLLRDAPLRPGQRGLRAPHAGQGRVRLDFAGREEGRLRHRGPAGRPRAWCPST